MERNTGSKMPLISEKSPLYGMSTMKRLVELECFSLNQLGYVWQMEQVSSASALPDNNFNAPFTFYLWESTLLSHFCIGAGRRKLMVVWMETDAKPAIWLWRWLMYKGISIGCTYESTRILVFEYLYIFCSWLNLPESVMN